MGPEGKASFSRQREALDLKGPLGLFFRSGGRPGKSFGQRCRHGLGGLFLKDDRRAARSFDKALPQGIHAHALAGRGDDRFDADDLAPFRLACRTFPLVALVGLGQDGQQGKPAGTGEAGKLQIQFLGRQAAVQQQGQGAQVLAGRKIFFQQGRPAAALTVAGPGIAVARQVYQKKVVGLHPVKIDGARLARCGADLGELFAHGQSVDERGLAHVGTAGQGHLGFRDIQELLEGVDGAF